MSITFNKKCGKNGFMTNFIERRNPIYVCNSTNKGTLRKDVCIYKEHKSIVESRVKVLVHRFKEKLRLL